MTFSHCGHFNKHAYFSKRLRTYIENKYFCFFVHVLHVEQKTCRKNGRHTLNIYIKNLKNTSYILEYSINKRPRNILLAQCIFNRKKFLKFLKI